jgi:putative aldouronate transport system permease protein
MMSKNTTSVPVYYAKKATKSERMKKRFKDFFKRDNLALYLLMLPTLAYIFIFHYIPLSGLVMAFEDFRPNKGIWGSEWVGLYHFEYFVSLPDFWNILKNTLVLSVYSIAINTVLPIVLALFMNEIRNKFFKKTVQTISYAPYFVSVMVVCGMLFSFANYDTGIINRVVTAFGGEKIRAMESESLFPHMYVFSGLWQGLGWWAIIYVGTLANVDQSLHEAAIIDGAGRLKRMWHINVPTILPMAIIMFIMSIGSMLSVGFEKVYLMQTPGNLSASRIISTYVYEVTFQMQIPDYGYGTAIGLFNSVINIFLLCVANTISRKVSETSLW